MSQEQTLSSARPPFVAIAMLSFAALSYEVLLTRLFSIIQWHHFAYMIISVALLGYGASGALITICQDWIKNQVKTLFVINIVLFSVFSIVCFFIAQALPFSPLEILWDTNQWVWLFLVYLCLFLPFLFAATSLGLVYRFFYYRIGPAYAADLVGAGMGALGIIVVLFILSPTQALIFISSLGLLAALVACFELKINGRKSWLLVLLLFSSWSVPEHWLDLVPSIYKAESQILNIKGTRIIEHRSSPLGLLNVVESPDVPFRYAPGLSLNADTELPSQIAVFTDGDAMTVITRVEGDVNDDRESLQFISHMMSALPYQILHKPDVLVLGAGGGAEVLQGLYYQARHIDAVELNPQIVDLVSKKYAEYSGYIFANKSVELHVADARAYVNRSDEHYDLIQLALLDSFNASSAGLYSLNESYLYTVEAVDEYIEHLTENGILALTRWIKLPPRDTLKLFATAIDALKRRGITNPEQYLVLVRNWNNSSLLIKRQPFVETELEKIRQFTQSHGFDLAYYPGITAGETNQFNILEPDYFYIAALALLGEQRDTFIKQYKYDIEPATDDRPYFFHFFKWSLLAEILSLPSNQGILLIEWGTLIVGMTLSQAIVASVGLIIFPLWLYRRRNKKTKKQAGISYIPVFTYFFAIGLAFMFIEIAFIQKFILFLGHPLYAIAVVLCAFLLFAGMGSALAKRFIEKFSYESIFYCIIGCCIVYMVLLPSIFQLFLGQPDVIKIMLSLVLIAPLAFFMGMPFPIGMSSLAVTSSETIPWAWGVNGCSSVISSVLVILLAMNFGFNIVIVFALGFYMLAGIVLFKSLTGRGSVKV